MNKYLQLIIFTLLASPVYAQVPVEKDPFHKIIFENKLVRLLDLQVSGSDTTTTHIHKAASVVVFVTKSSLAIQVPGEAPVITNVDAGNTIYRAYDEKPTIHKVWSHDGSAMRCIVIEIKQDSIQRK
jgi:hypothetical protein